MLTDCALCLGTGQQQIGSGEENLCPVCYGTGAVDPADFCACGRAATQTSPTGARFCGRIWCFPDKKPTKQETRSPAPGNWAEWCCS